MAETEHLRLVLTTMFFYVEDVDETTRHNLQQVPTLWIDVITRLHLPDCVGLDETRWLSVG